VAPDQVGGYRKPALEGEREWVLARIAEKPDLTLRALAAELSDRGVKAGPYAVWSFFKREGLTFKKNTPRGRAGPAGRGPQAGAVEAASE
jgi:putative transposase